LFASPINYENEINTLITWAKEIPVDGIVYATQAMKNRRNQLKVCVELGAKLLVIQGEKDQSTPLQMMSELLPKENQLFVITGIGHMSYIESPELVIQKLESFLS
jgi:pimeloyl-ACP methyl ester carboxylesterase